MNTSTEPRVGDTAKKLTMINGGTTLVPVTIAQVVKSGDPDYPYLVTFEYSYTSNGEMHGGEIMTRLNARGEDQHGYTIDYRRAEHVEYVVPVDPINNFQCDSCQ